MNTIYCCPDGEPPEPAESKESKRTQASMVKLAGRSAGASGICTKPLVPSKLNAEPTTPMASAVAPPWSVPLLVPARLIPMPLTDVVPELAVFVTPNVAAVPVVLAYVCENAPVPDEKVRF